MFKNIFSKTLLGLLSLILIFPLAGTALAQDTSAEERGTILCQRTNLAGENIMEIPIGRAVDEAQYLADEILFQAYIILDRAQRQIDESTRMQGLVAGCGIDWCGPDCREQEVCGGCDCRGCNTTTQISCDYRVCGVIAPGHTCCCPILIRCEEGAPGICDLVRACNEETESRSPDVCANECQQCSDESLSHCCCTVRRECRALACVNRDTPGPGPGLATNNTIDRACQPGIAEAAAVISALYAEILAAQQRIAYLYGFFEADVIPLIEESRTKLFNCFLSETDFDAVMRGERSGKWMFSCTDLIKTNIRITSRLPFWDTDANWFDTPRSRSEGCYGNIYCKNLDSNGEQLPFGSPGCMDDYYCCIMSKVNMPKQ